MKKIGKKLSYITKVLLVIGLIISNLSSLSIVFAYEGDNDELDSDQIMLGTSSNFNASIDDENKITITYAGEVNDTDELAIGISEKYIYSNCTVTDSVPACDIILNNTYDVLEEDRELLFGDGMVIEYVPSVLPQAKFDGAYELSVKLFNVTQDNTLLEEKIVAQQNVTFDSGIEFKLYDQNDNLIAKDNGKYVISLEATSVKVVGKMLPGGLSPNDEFIYGNEEETYTASEILELGLENVIDFSNRLYGDYKQPVSISYVKNGEETTYVEHFDISYGTYSENAKVINTYVDSSKMLFESSTKDGNFYVYLGEDLITINDLNQVLNNAYSENKNITYVISNDDYSFESGGILSGYDNEGEETLEEYLSKILVDASTKISITDGFLTITYQALVVGDLNGDNNLDENDLVALIDQLVGNKDLDKAKANIYDLDDEVTVLDVMELDQVIKSGTWNVALSEEEIELDAKLELVNSEKTITSGDEFEVSYILTPQNDGVINGIAGIVIFDDKKLELVSITKQDDFVGSDKDGKFIYVGTSSKPVVLASQVKDTSSDEALTLVTLKFRALAGGTSTITLDNPEYFNQDVYYKIVEIDDVTGESSPTSKVISLDVTVSESSDNSLSSLKFGDNTIQLVDGVYNYKLTVSNDVKSVNIQALVANIAAHISSIVAPEELVEGDNTITITVASESGDEQTYTIIVTREKAVEQANNTSNYVSYQDNTSSSSVDNKPQEPPKSDDKKDTELEPEKNSSLSKIIVIVLILLVIGGLVYLIFKNDDDDETKKTNKDINKFKKDDFGDDKEQNISANNKKNQNKNNKKER